jgi:hypothetical protein
MLESIIKLKEFLFHVLPAKFTWSSAAQVPVLLANDIVIIEDIISILNSFDIITKSVEKFVSTAKIIRLTKCLISKLLKPQILSPEVVTLRRNLLKHVEDRFNKICHSNQYKIATFLDPRFKNVMLDDLQSLREYIKKEYETTKEKILLNEAMQIIDNPEDVDDPAPASDSSNIKFIFSYVRKYRRRK